MPEPLLATEADPNTEGADGQGGADDSSSTATAEEQAQQKAAADKAAADAKAAEAPKAPETYEFTNPEGTELFSKEVHDAFAEAARDNDLPQDKAQALFTKTTTSIHERAVAEQVRQTNEWIEATKSDKDIGGDKLEENLAIAKKARDEFGSDGLRELLDAPNGIGNHPEIIRWMVKVGKAISEDRFVDGSTGTAVDLNDEEAVAAKLYKET